MRKHFLILMLMALLPLAGWAQTATLGEMTLGIYTYGDNALPLPQVKDVQGAILTKDVHYEVVDGAFTDAECQHAVTALSALKADGTQYYRKVNGIGTYVGQSKTAYFTVKKKTLNITISTNFHRAYNTTGDPTIASGDWNSTDFAFSQTKSVLGGTLAYDYAGKGIKTHPAGEYPITFSGLTSDNYDIKYPTDKKFTIDAINMTGQTVTVKEGTAIADKTYKGYTYTAGDLTGLKLVWGTKELTQGEDFDVTLDVFYNFSSYSAASGGTHYSDGTVCMLSQDGTDAIVEVVTNPAYTEWVGKKFKVALTANNSTRVQLYGDGTGNDYTTASGVWVTVNAATLAKDVNTYSYGVKYKGNYSGTKANVGTFKVVAAPIVVSIDDIKKTYDGTNWKDHNFATPVLYADKDEYNAAKGTNLSETDFNALSDAQKTKIAAAKFNYSGLVGEDLASATAIANVKNGFSAPTSVVITTDAQDVKAGGYNLTISGAGAGTSTNYMIASYIPGKLIIEQAKLELKAKDANKGIGADDPEFELDATANLVAGHVITGVTFTRADGETAGTFDITPVYSAAKVYSNFGIVGQKDETDNYEFAVAATKGKLTIGKSTIYVTIKDKEKFYGQGDPEFESVVTGLIGEDQLGDFTISRADGENVGSYALTAEIANPNTAKYDKVVVANGILTIKKAELTFTIPAQNVVTGNKKNALKKDNITVAGIFKDADKGTGSKALYTLDFNAVTLDTDSKITGENNTYATGIIATLTDAAKANYVVVGDNKVAPTAPATESVAATGKLIVNDGTAFALNFLSSDATTSPAYVGDYTLIKEHAGETQNVTINFTNRNRKINATANVHTWAADNWNALVLPFDITVAELSSKLGHATGGAFNYVVVNTIKKDAPAGKFQFQLFTGTIPANTPFMVKTVGKITTTVAAEAATINVPIAFGAKTIVAPASETVEAKFDNGFKLVGKYKNFVIDKTMPMDEGASPVQGYYKFLYGDDDSQYRTFGPSSSNSWTIVPFDAYVDLSGDPEAHNVVFEFEEADGSTTSIKAIASEADNANVKMTGWYTINGTKLQAAPTQKGIYIFNGKKLVVK